MRLTENRLILAFGSLALALSYATLAFTSLPQWVGFAVIIVVGVLVPMVLSNRLALDGE